MTFVPMRLSWNADKVEGALSVMSNCYFNAEFCFMAPLQSGKGKVCSA